ncbi:hypothetical protein DV515_00019008, partial [Chloebia gouldiae]
GLGGVTGDFGDPPDPPCAPPQNIDTLERVAGLDPELLVEAHGTFFTSHCLRPSCRQSYSLAWMRGTGGSGTPPSAGKPPWHPPIPLCPPTSPSSSLPERIFSSLVPKCEKCQGLVKPGEFWGGQGWGGFTPPPPPSPDLPPPPPDIVFFGESLPARFFTLLESVSGIWGALNPPPPSQPAWNLGNPPHPTSDVPSLTRTLRRLTCCSSWAPRCRTPQTPQIPPQTPQMPPDPGEPPGPHQHPQAPHQQGEDGAGEAGGRLGGTEGGWQRPPPPPHRLCPPQSDPLMSLMGFGGMDFDSDKAYRWGALTPPHGFGNSAAALETLKVVLGSPRMFLGTPEGGSGDLRGLGPLEAILGFLGARRGDFGVPVSPQGPGAWLWLNSWDGRYPPTPSPTHEFWGSICPPNPSGTPLNPCVSLQEELEELVRREHAAIDAKAGDRDGEHPQKHRGDEDKDGGNPKKSLGDKARAEKDPKKPQGDKEKTQNDPEKSQGGHLDCTSKIPSWKGCSWREAARTDGSGWAGPLGGCPRDEGWETVIESSSHPRSFPHPNFSQDLGNLPGLGEGQ